MLKWYKQEERNDMHAQHMIRSRKTATAQAVATAAATVLIPTINLFHIYES